VALRNTTYVPVSLGVKLKAVPLPEAYALPFLVTDQASVKVSPGIGVVAEPVKAMAVPSGLLAGAPVMLGVGATLFTVMVAEL
jgi:hypothetical protein